MGRSSDGGVCDFSLSQIVQVEKSHNADTWKSLGWMRGPRTRSLDACNAAREGEIDCKRVGKGEVKAASGLVHYQIRRNKAQQCK